MLTFHAIGNWARDAMRVENVTSQRHRQLDVESIIETTWEMGKKEFGERLFDGPMCRLESWNASLDHLSLALSPTSYRIFFGTNLRNAHLADQFGRDVMANSVGTSSILQTADGFLMFGRRNFDVAYYPNRVHPFAGSLEPRDLPDVCVAADRELHEECGLRSEEIESICCLGLVEDWTIRQPELIFHVRAKLSRQQIESQVHAAEHGGSVAVESKREAVKRMLANAKEFTPVGIASLLLFGNDAFGVEWFNRAAPL